MLPTRDQIERAAYDRWLRRHRAHGHDRVDWLGSEIELTYLLNYETAVDYRLDSSSRLTLGIDPARRCRFCERTARHTTFSSRQPVVQCASETSLETAQVCDECQADCRDPLAVDCANLWKTLSAGAANPPVVARGVDALAVFKSLVTSALLIMPEPELAYFTDTLEWVNNPDHEYDAGLFAGTYGHVYRDRGLGERSWISLARRIADDAPFPYMVCFLAWGGMIVQIAVPLSVRDHDLDGRCAHLPGRSLIAGEGPDFRDIRPAIVPLVEPASRPRAGRRRALVLV